MLTWRLVQSPPRTKHADSLDVAPGPPRITRWPFLGPLPLRIQFGRRSLTELFRIRMFGIGESNCEARSRRWPSVLQDSPCPPLPSRNRGRKMFGRAKGQRTKGKGLVRECPEPDGIRCCCAGRRHSRWPGTRQAGPAVWYPRNRHGPLTYQSLRSPNLHTIPTHCRPCHSTHTD